MAAIADRDAQLVLDEAIEILPHTYNAPTATCMALYEHCRQWPEG